jgi:hypothetical protein
MKSRRKFKKEGGKRAMLDALKNFDARRASLEGLVEISAQARIAENEFTTLGLEAPDWFEPTVASLRREIKTRTADARAARLRDLKNRREALKTPDEKRSAIDKQIEELEALEKSTT